jgi:hypothetical protein
VGAGGGVSREAREDGIERGGVIIGADDEGERGHGKAKLKMQNGRRGKLKTGSRKIFPRSMKER